MMAIIAVTVLILTSGSALAQLGYCLGNFRDPACQLQRQMEEQERQNQSRHEQMMREMRRQNQQLEQPQPYRGNSLYPDINFPRLFDGPIR